jgi:hypothetical protein
MKARSTRAVAYTSRVRGEAISQLVSKGALRTYDAGHVSRGNGSRLSRRRLTPTHHPRTSFGRFDSSALDPEALEGPKQGALGCPRGIPLARSRTRGGMSCI